MIAYLAMLFSYDWRLTIISILFPPAAYWLAGILKRTVSRSAAAYKESAGVLNGATLDRISNAVLYRVYGQEKSRDTEYEERLGDYEKKAVYANIWENAMQPLYKIISMAGIIFHYLDSAQKMCMGSGWTSWDIAAFSTFFILFLPGWHLNPRGRQSCLMRFRRHRYHGYGLNRICRISRMR